MKIAYLYNCYQPLKLSSYPSGSTGAYYHVVTEKEAAFVIEHGVGMLFNAALYLEKSIINLLCDTEKETNVTSHYFIYFVFRGGVLICCSMYKPRTLFFLSLRIICNLIKHGRRWTWMGPIWANFSHKHLHIVYLSGSETRIFPKKSKSGC